MAFDPLNLLLLAIAIVVFWRLRSVLGSRTGSERPPIEPYSPSRKKEAGADAEATNGNVLRFPKDDSKDLEQRSADGEPAEPLWTGYAEAGSAVASGLEAIAASDRAFSPKSFVEGAKLAYEMIVDAFARGDKSALKPLLSREVLDGFARAIDEREAAGQKIDARFVGIDKASIMAAGTAGRKANITMRFVSELISATLSKDGAVIEGHPTQIREITDVWTFERDLNSRDPNWKLVSTEEPA